MQLNIIPLLVAFYKILTEKGEKHAFLLKMATYDVIPR